KVQGKSPQRNNNWSLLETRRQRSSLGGGLYKGFNRTAKVEVTPVQSFVKETSYNLGDRVYHHDFGEGEVQKLKEMRGRAMIDVYFTTGRVVTFFTDSALLEKLGKD
ncbi:MAG: hypothetical protein WC224_00245, partial [Sphaerochaetaceae bacterium]